MWCGWVGGVVGGSTAASAGALCLRTAGVPLLLQLCQDFCGCLCTAATAGLPTRLLHPRRLLQAASDRTGDKLVANKSREVGGCSMAVCLPVMRPGVRSQRVLG